jgi:predicted small secreted protein
MKKITIILTLTLISLLLITSCNTADEGVFQRIRESVPKVDVGSLDIIGITADDSTLYAYTSKKGFQVYDIGDINNPTSLSINNVYPGLYTANDSTSITEVYYSEGGEAGSADTLMSLVVEPAVGTPTDENNTEIILQMSPQHDLMLVDDGDGDYSVLSVSTGTSIHSFNDIFHTNYKPRLISQANTQFIVSGRNAADTAYIDYYLDSATALTEDGSSTVGTFDDYPIVAMMDDGTNLVVVNSNGEVWSSPKTDYTAFELVGTIPNFPDRDPADMPYPFFIYNNRIILQNENNVFYEITDTAITELDDYSQLIEKMNNIQAKSYLVDVSDLYVGTMQNGIFKIDMPIS